MIEVFNYSIYIITEHIILFILFVLFINKGEDYSPENGPDPKLESWHRVWSAFGEAHDTESKDGSHYSVS